MSRNNSKQIKLLLDKLNICYGIIRSIVHIVNAYLDDITIENKDAYLLMIQQLITLNDARLLLEELNKSIAECMDGGAKLVQPADKLTVETTVKNEKEKKLYDIIQQFYSISIGIQNSVSHIILKKPASFYAKKLHKEECACPKTNPNIKCCPTNEIIFKNLIYEYRKLNYNFEELRKCLEQKLNITTTEPHQIHNYSIKCKEMLTNIQDTNGGNFELYKPIFEIFDEPPKQIIDDSKLYIKIEKTVPKPEPKPKKKTKCDYKKCAAPPPPVNILPEHEIVTMQAENIREDSISIHDSDSTVDVSVNTDPIKFRKKAIDIQKSNITDIGITHETSISTIPLSPQNSDIKDIEKKEYNEKKPTIVNNIETNRNGTKSKRKEIDTCEEENCIYIRINKENQTFQDISNQTNPGNELPIYDKRESVCPEIQDGEFTRSVSLIDQTEIRNEKYANAAPNISIVNQDALSPVVWALTRVKVSDDGAKIFEVLDVSPFPPGRYLFNAPNQLHLLGIQPNHNQNLKH